MNTENITIYPIPAHTQAWYDFRRNGIGGSEGSVPMGLNEYNNPTKMFYEKLGLTDPWIPDNEKLFWGRELEEEVGNKWQYYDGTPLGYLQNYADKKIIRRCRKINGYAVNKDYPWLFGSLDRVINRKGGFKLTDGSMLDEEQVLEIKTMENFVSDKWEGGLPVYHIIQVHVYMIIMEMNYAEIAVLKNGRYLSVFPIDRNEELCKQIIAKTKDFWYNHVVPAQPYAREFILAQVRGDQQAMDNASRFIQKYEPDPVAGDSYRNFLSDRFTKVHESIKGPQWLFAFAKRHKEMGAAEKYFAREKSLCANTLAKFLVDNHTSKIEFEGDRGHVWLASKGGGTKYADNRAHVVIDELKVIKSLQQIPIDFVK